MKIAILAADDVKQWDRHSIEIYGATLLQRLVVQLGARGHLLPSISSRFPGQHKVHGAKEIINPLTGNDLGCIVGIMDQEFDLYIFGDVFFTNEAIDAILAGTDEFYGRTKSSGVKNYGEMFAIKATPRLNETLRRMWSEYKSGKRRRLWSWDLYSEIQGKDFYQHRNTGNFTEINDMTEDFDKPADIDRWRQKYESQ